MKLEEAIKILTDDNKTYQLNKLLNDILNIESSEYYQAVETVLKELEKLQKDNYKLDRENQLLFESHINLEKIEEEHKKLNGELNVNLKNSIPKKKIEEYLTEETEKYKVYKKEVDKNENLRPQLWNHLGRKNMCEKILGIEKIVTLNQEILEEK